MEYGFLSVIPPLVTIVLALVLKNVFVSLLIGLFLSSFILSGSARQRKCNPVSQMQ